MANKKRNNPVEEQRARQRELIELKRQKEAFSENPERYQPEEIKTVYVQSTKSKLSNFWYYSRFTIIGVLIIAIIMAVAVTQCATKTKYDLTIVLYFKSFADSTMSENLATVAEEYCEDFNGDGKVEVLVVNCAGTDEQRKNDANSSTRLLGQFQNEKAIVYIVDTDAYKDLESNFGDDFIYKGMKLPDRDGSAYKLNGTAFDAAFNTVSPNYTNEFDYYVMRRNVSDKATANKDGVGKYVREAERFINAVMADPYLDSKLPENTSSDVSSTESTVSGAEQSGTVSDSASKASSSDGKPSDMVTD